MCISGCTAFNELGPIIGILGIILIFADYKFLGKKVIKSTKLLAIAAVVFIAVIVLAISGIPFFGGFEGIRCDYYGDIILCKYLGTCTFAFC